jgi:SAM-dependent methyltransferase
MLAFRPNTIGVDINPRTIDWCRARGLDAMLMQPDVLPFQDGAFTGVLLDNVLEHLLVPEPLLSEIHRVLKVGGTLVVGVPGKRGYDAAPDHKTHYDESALTQKLLESNFVCRRLFHMPLASNRLSSRMSQDCIYGVFSRR